MISLDDIRIVWSEIKKHNTITVQQLRENLQQKNPEILDKLANILLHLHKLCMIDYDGDKVKVTTIIDQEILQMPCMGCERLKTCRPGSKTQPFKCDKFVKWFMKHFVET